MLFLLLGLAVFFGVHFMTSRRQWRSDTLEMVGEGVYKGVYSAISFVGLALIAYGFGAYRAEGYIPLWSLPKGFMHLNLLLSSLAMVMIFAANKHNGLIKSTLKHPFLIGIKTWALGHLLANGDMGSLLIFGSFLVYAVINRIQLKKRGIENPPKMPFGKGDIQAITIGVAVSAFLIMGGHKWLIGVSAIAR
jgi:uncharacterized membrane protein